MLSWKNGTNLQVRQSREENIVRRPPSGVSLGLGAVEAIGSPRSSFQPQTVVFGADVWDSGEFDSRGKAAESRDWPHDHL